MKPIIDAKEARDNIRAGMSETDLMEKFRLSPKGLRSLVNKLVASGAMSKSEVVQLLPKINATADDVVDPILMSPFSAKEVNAYEAARDIRSGMSNGDLMKKYGISPSGLENLFEQLVGEALILPSELQFRLSSLSGMTDTIHSGSVTKKSIETSKQETVWTCPACGRRQSQEYDECPVCGVIVAKFRSHFSR